MDPDSEDEIGPPLPPQMIAGHPKEDENKSDDEDMIGPPMPLSMQSTDNKSKSQSTDKLNGVKSVRKDADEETDSEDEDDMVRPQSY